MVQFLKKICSSNRNQGQNYIFSLWYPRSQDPISPKHCIQRIRQLPNSEWTFEMCRHIWQLTTDNRLINQDSVAQKWSSFEVWYISNQFILQKQTKDRRIDPMQIILSEMLISAYYSAFLSKIMKRVIYVALNLFSKTQRFLEMSCTSVESHLICTIVASKCDISLDAFVHCFEGILLIFVFFVTFLSI